MTMHARTNVHGASVDDPAVILLSIVMEEIRSTATDTQERGFLLAIGRRIAAAWDMSGIGDLRALEAGMNDAWRALGAGDVRLAPDAAGIAIDHRADRHDAIVDPVMLEGAYDRWFGALGGPNLSLRLVERTNDRIAFHYGR